MADRWIVRVMRGYPWSPEYFDEYLAALRHDPYQRADARTHSTSKHQSEAFRFRTLAAAEVAAVFVGGRVVKLTKKTKDNHND